MSAPLDILHGVTSGRTAEYYRTDGIPGAPSKSGSANAPAEASPTGAANNIRRLNPRPFNPEAATTPLILQGLALDSFVNTPAGQGAPMAAASSPRRRSNRPAILLFLDQTSAGSPSDARKFAAYNKLLPPNLRYSDQRLYRPPENELRRTKHLRIREFPDSITDRKKFYYQYDGGPPGDPTRFFEEQGGYFDMRESNHEEVLAGGPTAGPSTHISYRTSDAPNKPGAGKEDGGDKDSKDSKEAPRVYAADEVGMSQAAARETQNTLLQEEVREQGLRDAARDAEYLDSIGQPGR